MYYTAPQYVVRPLSCLISQGPPNQMYFVSVIKKHSGNKASDKATRSSDKDAAVPNGARRQGLDLRCHFRRIHPEGWYVQSGVVNVSSKARFSRTSSNSGCRARKSLF